MFPMTADQELTQIRQEKDRLTLDHLLAIDSEEEDYAAAIARLEARRQEIVDASAAK